MRVYTVYMVVALLIVSCGMAPLYDKAQITEGWDTAQGFMYQDESLVWEPPDINFSSSRIYEHFSIVRYDVSYYHAKSIYTAVVPRFGFGVQHSKERTIPLVDFGIGAKFAVYPSPTWCLGLKYDLGWKNLQAGGQLFLLAGIKSHGAETFTVSLFANPLKADYVDARVAAAGLNIAYHLNPRITLVSGSNFFFTQDLSREAEPYVVFWFGVGF